jgi:hypothetical protein
MKSPVIGRGIALALIVGLVAWTALRALGSRPPETPKTPFPAPAVDRPQRTPKASKPRFSRAVVSGAFKLCSNNSREFPR